MHAPPRGLYNAQHEHDACGVAFLAHMKGEPSHQLVQQGLAALVNLQHRGGCGADARTGDGAGILLQMPDRFLRDQWHPQALPPLGFYGAGLVFLPQDAPARAHMESLCEKAAHEVGCHLLGFREVPVDLSAIGVSAAACAPAMRQVFIGGDAGGLERQLYALRKRWEHSVDRAPLPADVKASFHVASLSSRTLVYKGMLTGAQVQAFFPDLRHPLMQSGLALVHQRFSTNTFPSWALAHPYRYVAHNGEINTLRGNINWMRARQGRCAQNDSAVAALLPVVCEGGSDTATFDNVLEFLHMHGRSLPHAVLMMMPEAWQKDGQMSAPRRAFFEYHAALMEPWDGPAALCFTDGRSIGAILDRNGLRPLRYIITDDHWVIMASEFGVIDVDPARIVAAERIRPGKMFLLDTEQGRIVDDDEVKDTLAQAHPYAAWLHEHQVHLNRLPQSPAPPPPSNILQLAQAFGYTAEDLRLILFPMARAGEETMGSMGTDTPLAVLSQRPRLLFDYFKQMFAQVTNPPLDAVRESLMTSMTSTMGPEDDLLRPTWRAARHIKLTDPILTNETMAALRACGLPGFSSSTLSLLYHAPGDALEQALLDLRRNAVASVQAGSEIIILSDRGIDAQHVAIPSLLATAAVHHELLRHNLRTQCALVVETGDAREVHHMALLLGYGASAVNPHVALDIITTQDDTQLTLCNYLKAVKKGLLKVMSKMGINTLQSYRGAQIFEAVGLSRSVVDAFFAWTPTRLGGATLQVVAQEVSMRHHNAYTAPQRSLPSGGEYQWRRDGEYHLFNPETVHALQHATRTGQYSLFKAYTRRVDDQSRACATLRGMLALRAAPSPLTLEAVEPDTGILQRFSTGAMSFGSISQEAHETLAIAMNRLGGKSNTGEGGEDAARYRDERRSAIKQVASGRFGVTSEYLVNADDLQIKMAQGAKPGEGGQLPGHKVYPWIARVRHATPGVGLISPPPHHDIYSIEDLAQLIFDLHNANPRARVHVKLVSEAGVGTVAAGVVKAHADVVLISGHDGGTGAAPLTSIKHAGIPWELGLAETQQVLIKNGLRERVVVQVDGQLKTGRDVIVAALLGAEEFGFATAPLVVSGCIMMRVCHLNTCPVGIATQDPQLRQRFTGQPKFVENFFRYIAAEVREYLAMLGFRRLDDIIGRADLLTSVDAPGAWKVGDLNLSALCVPPGEGARHRPSARPHSTAEVLDRTFLPLCEPALAQRTRVTVSATLRNVHRAVGTLLGSEVTRRHGGAGLPDGTICLQLTGTAGQSFGAFVPAGMTLTLEGGANDGVGKGLSGGRLVLYPSPRTACVAEDSVLIGNVALYGATAGELFVHGIAGERFAVRNSGALAVVEGVGDHGCEYMTGGEVVVLGCTGRNFAAGMSGGVAYVLDAAGLFETRINGAMVLLQELDDTDAERVQDLIARHVAHTGSQHAARILSQWPHMRQRMVKVMPKDLLRVRQSEEAARAQRRCMTVAEFMGAAHG